MAPGAARRTRRERIRDERGWTVVELSLGVLTFAIITTAVLSVLNATQNHTRIQEAKVGNQETVRLALLNLQQDLRAANPLEPLTASSDYATEVELALGPAAGPHTYVRWQLTGTTLYRMTLNQPGGTATSTVAAVTGVQDIARGLTLFRYFNSNGNELTAGNSQPGDFSSCSTRILVTITAQPQLKASAFADQSGIDLRNRTPGGLGC